jgi:hypothetical protein
MSEFQHFIFELSNHLGGTALELDEDLLQRALALKIPIPAFLQDVNTPAEGSSETSQESKNLEPLVLVSPGLASKSPGQSTSSVVQEIKVLCGRVGRWTVCLECGWIWCKVTITRRF